MTKCENTPLTVEITVDELAAIFALADIPGIGSQRLNALLSRFSTAQAVIASSLNDLTKSAGIGDDVARAIQRTEITDEYQSLARRVKNKDIRVLHFLNYNYPGLLKEISDPPTLLYTAGKILEEDERAIAIVGTRSSSTYGHTVARELTQELVANGFTIVSGLARGIDTVAHKAAIESGGRTIAVLGSGIDNIYPGENTSLARAIANQGCVCTEYTLGAAPDAVNFPERNRIISGLSMGTVVIEAGHKSGALLTALIALDQNREVFAVPGRIDSPRSVGANRLIKHGAKLVQTIDDILEELSGQLSLHIGEHTPKKDPELSEEERQIFNLLSADPVHVDDIALRLEKPTPAVLTCLLDMELRSVVKQLPGKLFVKI